MLWLIWRKVEILPLVWVPCILRPLICGVPQKRIQKDHTVDDLLGQSRLPRASPVRYASYGLELGWGDLQGFRGDLPGIYFSFCPGLM